MRSSPRVSQPSADCESARIAGRYRIEGSLGRGGAAQVLRVTDEASGQVVALKRLRRGSTARNAALFELEYQTLASLKHPRIVTAFDYGRDGDCGFYTMELLAGDDLKTRAPVPWREACGYLRDAAQALGVMHARRLLHRDVSPRNLLRTLDGRVKLIDFGALSPFGPTDQVVGTPPFVAPEALRTGELDQRADLFALGAVAYFLVTGQHAYAARDLRELPELWEQGFVPASRRVTTLARSDLPPLPAELDRLISALLQPEVLARPSSAEELIDRIDALLGEPHLSREELPQARISNSAFVGREHERRRLRRLLALANKGQGQYVLIEGAEGIGRTRLLRELALEAQVVPATVLHVDVASCAGLYGVASALAIKLLTALPEVASAAAAPHASMLALVSPRLREKLRVPLGAQPSDISGGAIELRVRMQAALRDWFVAVARSEVLVVLVDGLELVDDGSAAFLLALASELDDARMLLGCTLRRESGAEVGASERRFAERARKLLLRPLDEPEVLALLSSVFGEAEHLERLCSRLQHAARGNPGYIHELIDQLVRRGLIWLAAGTWVLPRELPAECLPSSHEQALIASLDLLGPGAAQLAELLSVPNDAFSIELAKLLSESISPTAFLHLGELLQRGVLTREGDTLHFEHARCREVLRARLTPERHKQTAAVLGAHLLAQPDGDSLTRLAAGLHLIEGGDERGAQIVTAIGLKLALLEHDRLRLALPLLERALALLRLEGRSEDTLVGLIVPLAMGGYYRDLRYADRYGDHGLRVLSELTGLTMARGLQRVLGGKLGVTAALSIASARLAKRRDPCLPSFGNAMLLMFNCAASLTAASTLIIDAEGAARRADTLAPLKALGADAAPGFMAEYCATIACGSRDTPAENYARWERTLARVESATPIRGLPDSMRKRYVASAKHVLGLLDGMTDGDRAPRAADELDGLGMFHEMMADQVRMMYFGNQGASAPLERARRRVEQHAIQHGTTAIVETWTISMLIGISMRAHDVIGLKRVSQQLQRMCVGLPLLEPVAARARAMYLVLHGKYDEALPALEATLSEPVRRRVGWGRNHATLAHVYNKLGQYDRARAACERVVAVMEPDDGRFVALYLPVLTELAVAYAGLGRLDEAHAQLDALLASHAPRRGPLTLGQIHEAGLEIALIAGDAEAASRHLVAAEEWLGATGIPTLVQHGRGLRQRFESLMRARHPSLPGAPEGSRDVDEIAEAERQLAGGAMSIAERGQRALALLARSAAATRGYLYLLDADGVPQLLVTLAETAPSAVVDSWVQRRVQRELEDEVTLGVSLHETMDVESDSRTHDGAHYRLELICAVGARAHGVLGICVLGSERAPPRCSLGLTSTVGHYLALALRSGAAAP